MRVRDTATGAFLRSGNDFIIGQWEKHPERYKPVELEATPVAPAESGEPKPGASDDGKGTNADGEPKTNVDVVTDGDDGKPKNADGDSKDDGTKPKNDDGKSKQKEEKK